MAGELAGDRLVRVDDRLRGAGLELGERIGAGADDEIATEQQVGAAGAQSHGMQGFRVGADADMADDGAALLRHAELIEHRGALALDVRGHAHDGADGDDTGAADARDQHAVGLLDRRQDRSCRQRSFGRALGCLRDRGLAFAQAAAFDRHEAGAEAVEAGIVLVAGRLVDRALGAELGLYGRHRQAVRGDRAVAAALADRLVDEHAPVGIGIGAALAAATLLGGAGLIVDQHRYALVLAQRALDLVELVAVMEGDAGRPFGADRILVRIVAHQGDATHAFGMDLLADRPGMDVAVVRLTASHGDGVVVKDLVGDVDVGRDRLAYREVARVEVRAVAQVLEDVRHVGEVVRADPRRALGAHVGEGLGVALHADRQRVAADAGHRHRAVGHLGRAVVRAAGAEVGDAGHASLVAHLPAGLALQPIETLPDAFAEGFQAEPVDQRGGDLVGRQLAVGLEELLAPLVGLADHDRPAVGRRIEQRVLELLLDDGPLLLDDQDLAFALREGDGALRLERPDHANLVDREPETPGLLVADAELVERLADVEIGLADGDDAEPRIGAAH